MMRPRETDMGGPGRAFQTTMWSDILAAGGPRDERTSEQLDRLVRTYWKPVYAYIRSSWKMSIEDAKDLTQAFFARFLEKEYWSRVQPERGSFRGYLKQAVQNFMINAHQRDFARRRAFSLDATRDELQQMLPAAPDEPPDRAYDRQWFRCLIDESFAELQASLEKQGKGQYAEVFRAYCLASSDDPASTAGASLGAVEPDPGPTYEQLAARFGLKKHDVRNILSYCRRVFRQIVRGRIREYVATDEDLERELKEVVRG